MENESTNGGPEIPALSGPVDGETGERLRPEQEVIAIAIASIGHPEIEWLELAPEQRETYMAMALASVQAAQEPLPAHEGVPTPPYPAELLDTLAEALAFKLLNPQQLSEGAVEALDRYQQEVGRENVPALVAKAVAEL